jgi:AGCS family alanine or glycine:cation symporter
MAHAAANVMRPADQGVWGIIEVVVDTILLCTLTALVVLTSGVPVKEGGGMAYALAAYQAVLGKTASPLLAVSVLIFAFATVLGWGLYGARCAQFLFGQDAWRKFSYTQIVAVILGAVMRTGTLWRMAEVVNGLMAIPNLVALWVMLPTLIQLIYDFNCGSVAADGGTYENFHQCESL